jgi:hypothetical protein
VSSQFDGAQIPEPEFAGDDGSADPELAGVLHDWWTGQATGYDVVDVLSTHRLIVPVVAVADEVDEGENGLRHEKSSHMATVTLIQPDGRRGLLAFTSMESLAAWDPQARGIPAGSRRVAEAAKQESADAVLIDVAGPVLYALTEPALTAVAEGRPWLRPHLDPEIHAAVDTVAAGIAGLASHEVIDGALQKMDVLIMLEIEPGGDVSALAEVLIDQLAEIDLVRDRCPRGVGIGVRGLPRPS